MDIQKELKKISSRTDIWREGEYIDLWSIPHFLSGVILSCVIHLFYFKFIISLALAIFLLIAYEIFEYVMEIEETVWNRRIDVLVGLSSFIPFTLLIVSWNFFEVFNLGLIVGVVDAILSYMGWMASQKGKLFEQKVKREYDFLKNKFLEKMKERRKKRSEKIAAKLALKQLKKLKHSGLLDKF